MCRRLFTSPHLKTLSPLSHSHPRSAAVAGLRSLDLTRHVATQSAGSIKKRVEDVVPIATGHEREEIQADLEGRNILEIDHPEGPFGTKETPAVVRSYYDRRIVGCPGGEGEDVVPIATVDYHTNKDDDKEKTEAKDHEKLDVSYEHIFKSKQKELEQTRRFFLPRFKALGENFTTNDLKTLFASNLCLPVSVSIHEWPRCICLLFCRLWEPSRFNHNTFDTNGRSVIWKNLFPPAIEDVVPIATVDYHTNKDDDKEKTEAKDHEKLDVSYEHIFKSKQKELEQTRRFFLPRFKALGENFTTNDLKTLFASNLCLPVSVSIHESGHAASAYYSADYGNPVGLTIIPSILTGGVSFGKTSFHQPSVYTLAYYKASLLVSMAGRSAEKFVLGNKNVMISGASLDIQDATHTATAMVTRWGVSDFLPPMKIYYGTKLAFPYSKKVISLVDDAIISLLREAKASADQMIVDHEDVVLTISSALLMHLEFGQEVLNCLFTGLELKGSPLSFKEIETIWFSCKQKAKADGVKEDSEKH